MLDIAKTLHMYAEFYKRFKIIQQTGIFSPVSIYDSNNTDLLNVCLTIDTFKASCVLKYDFLGIPSNNACS